MLDTLLDTQRRRAGASAVQAEVGTNGESPQSAAAAVDQPEQDSRRRAYAEADHDT
jgi:hypothetical protein